MVVFNECRVDKEGKNIIIDASISTLPYYENIMLNYILIDTDKSFTETGPSANNIYKRKIRNAPSGTKEPYIDLIEDEVILLNPDLSNNRTTMKISINYKDLKNISNLNDNIFFIYIGVEGVPASDTPCGMDKEYSIAVAVNMRQIYNASMGYLKELEDTCNPPKGLIDMILRLKAFELSLKTGNFLMAIKYWDKLFKNKKIVSTTKGCGCNGIYP